MLKYHCPNGVRQRGRKGKNGLDAIHDQKRKATACKTVLPSTWSVSPSETFLDFPQHLRNNLYYCA